MEPRANYALIGAVVIFAAVSLMGFVLWLGQAQFRESFAEYDIVFEGPVTLDEGASVRYIGIKVGEVRWIRIDRSDPSKVRTRIRIASETPVKTDSTAIIDFAGITGVTFVQINAGSVDAPALERLPGQPVPIIDADRTQLEELINSSRTILGQAGETADQVNKLLSEDNIARVSSTLASLEQITARMAEDDALVESLDATLKSLRDTSDRFNEVGRRLETVGESADERIAELGVAIADISEDTQTALNKLMTLTDESQRVVSQIADTAETDGAAAMSDARLAIQDFRRLTQRLDALVRDLEQNPQALVAGDPLPYEESR